MKKTILCLVLVLGLVFMGWSQESGKAAPKENFKIKPRLYWSVITPLVIRSDFSRLGITILGFDGSIFQYKNFCFLSAGLGFQAYQDKVTCLHYDEYYGYWYGPGYEFFFGPYLKFTPVKYRWDALSKSLGINAYVELGIAINPFKNRKDTSIVIGLTFSGKPFKKEPKGEEN